MIPTPHQNNFKKQIETEFMRHQDGVNVQVFECIYNGFVQNVKASLKAVELGKSDECNSNVEEGDSACC